MSKKPVGKTPALNQRFYHIRDKRSSVYVVRSVGDGTVKLSLHTVINADHPITTLPLEVFWEDFRPVISETGPR